MDFDNFFNKMVVFFNDSKSRKTENTNNDDFFDDKKLKQYNLPTRDPHYTKAPYQQNRIYKCKNGNFVRSKSEREISDFLTEHQIKHAYEKAIKTEDINHPYIHPDFYLPGIVTHAGRIIEDIYIEHLGGPMSNDIDTINKYRENNKHKFKLYKKMKLTVLCTYEEDMINPNASLKKKLLTIKENQINYLREN